ncbi:hypothetical protein NLJ89_g11838 [Agrocybe chaxingu]|uniref:Uncharacterized protein n=1 Tax=Agrocybe chaxingu TaxID=84603 RepID=A0A9W8JN05_9AGAR|nr:hypothetical protein NLJ89_g11838 [Agrocybe chaxingu]
MTQTRQKLPSQVQTLLQGPQAKSPFGSNAPPSPAESPTTGSFALSPPSSPEPAQKTTSPFGGAASTTPAKFSGGAFGNIQVTPSAFKPATGFGAFGSTTPTDSPFMKKPEASAAPVSVFNLSSTPTKTPASAASPAFGTSSFGTPSTLGAQKSPFTPASPASPTPGIKPVTSSGGFSAFSGQTSAFGDAWWLGVQRAG